MSLFEIERCECGGRSGRPLHHRPDEGCADCAAGSCSAALCIECGASATAAVEATELAATP